MIDAIKAENPYGFAVRDLCEALGVSRSGYYAHLHKARCPRRREELRDRGHRAGRRRIARLMRQQGLRPKQKRRFVPKTTDSRHGGPVAPFRLAERAAPSAPNQVWVTDITYIPTREGWLYPAAEMDLYSRRIAGWEACGHME